MTKLEEFTKRLSNPATLPVLEKAVNKFILFAQRKEAFEVYRTVSAFFAHSDFSQKYPKLYDQYREQLVVAEFAALSLLSDQEVIQLFREKARQAFTIDLYDVREELKIKLLSIWVPKRDELKRKIKKALVENTQNISQQPIQLHDKPVKPTIGNWILSYNEVLGTEIAEKIKLSKYFTDNPNFKNLVEDEKKIVKNILDFYEQLKHKSLSLEGLEEDVPVDDEGREGVIKQGVFEKFDAKANAEELTMYQEIIDRVVAEEEAAKSGKREETPAKTVPSPQPKDKKIQQAYKGDQTEEKAIDDLMQQLAGQKATEVLFKSINSKDKKRVIAVLRLLAQERQLEKIITVGGQLSAMFEGYMQAKFGPEIVTQFKQNPNKPVYVYSFLQYILQDKLGLSSSESARQAIHLANIYSAKGNDQYLKMAYADEQSGEFNWAEVVKGNKGLEVKR
ncbi:MAG: hypothetical protein ABIB97_02510 [Patescibacteria group bacterium]